MQAAKGHLLSQAISTKYPHWPQRQKGSPQNDISCLLKATGALPGVSGQYKVPETTVWWHHGGQRLWNGCVREFTGIYFFNWLTFPFWLKCILKFCKINKEKNITKRDHNVPPPPTKTQTNHIVAASLKFKCPSETARTQDLETCHQPRATRVPWGGATNSPVNGHDLKQPLRLKVGFCSRTDTMHNSSGGCIKLLLKHKVWKIN